MRRRAQAVIIPCMTEPTLTLVLTPTRLARHCEGVLRVARHPAQAVATFTALQTFLGRLSGPDQQLGEAYAALRQVLDASLAEAEARLLAANAATLRRALADRSADAVARLHASLSRSGFHAVLARVVPELGASAPAVRDWAMAWAADAEARGRAASPYPDALDLARAGIALETYAAMQDCARGLAELSA
jgi:hypothetical protein